MSERPSFLRRHRVLAWLCGVALVLLIVAAIGISIVLRNAEPILRAQIVGALEQQFHARVELDSFQMSLTGGLRAEGRGLRIWPPSQEQGAAVPASSAGQPIISIDDFSFRAPLHYSPTQPIRISVVKLRGLLVDLPPKSHVILITGDKPKGGSGSGALRKALLHFMLDSVDCTDAVLRLETNKPGKLPLVFKISSLKLTGIQPSGTMDFTADLVNAVPKGMVQTAGKFGPWSVEDPEESQVQGQYTFDNANLGDFKDISGTLHSTGHYTGTLRELAVEGTADVPNFALTHIGTAMPLHTEFNANVDATNGDTWLQPVNAVLGESHFTVEGKVVRVPVSEAEAAASQNPNTNPRAELPSKGHDISLNVNVAHGRLEDFIRLVSKSGAPMLTGVLNLKTALEIPPGKEHVYLRLKLKGTFQINNAQFTSAKVQDRVTELSLRGQGLTKAKDKNNASPVQSAMQSSFTMADGVVTLPNLLYQVPGADVALNGTYGIDGGAINFTGNAKMQATVSQMLGGWKGALATPLDGFFKKDGAGTEVGVQVDGTRDNPHFGFDIRGLKHTSPQRPGDNAPDGGPVKAPSPQ
jgi:AsmA-like C-terminal region